MEVNANVSREERRRAKAPEKAEKGKLPERKDNEFQDMALLRQEAGRNRLRLGTLLLHRATGRKESQAANAHFVDEYGCQYLNFSKLRQ